MPASSRSMKCMLRQMLAPWKHVEQRDRTIRPSFPQPITARPRLESPAALLSEAEQWMKAACSHLGADI